jgi:hypothetical protein
VKKTEKDRKSAVKSQNEKERERERNSKQMLIIYAKQSNLAVLKLFSSKYCRSNKRYANGKLSNEKSKRLEHEG